MLCVTIFHDKALNIEFEFVLKKTSIDNINKSKYTAFFY
jgi:hypothetical protein